MKSSRRGKQVAPTRQQETELRRMLLDMAESGDIAAAGWALLLNRMDHIEKRLHQIGD